MQRDMDLIRELMLKIESGENVFEVTSDEVAACLGIGPTGLSRESAAKLKGHLELLVDAGFASIEMQGGGGPIMMGPITWAGHDFISSVREPEVWKETKSRAGKVGSWTVDLLSGLAKGYAKAKAAEYGFPMS